MASQSQDKELPTGQLRPSSTWGEVNNIGFMVQQAIGKLQTATLVRIEKCTNDGGVSPVGFVDVTPLVNQLDASGSPTPHVTIFNVPYLRVQGGRNAIIADPEVGDIGVCVFASRDIAKVKSTKSAANPGSFRQYSFADGLYIGGMLNGSPTQYVQFSADGIVIHSPGEVRLEAPKITLVGGTEVRFEAPTIGIHAGKTWTWDVAGFGEGVTHLSGNLWQRTTWQTGAIVTTVNLPINPPDGTPP